MIPWISRGFAVSPAAGARPSISWVPRQLCPSHQQGVSMSQLNQEWAPQYLVQLFPNTGSSMSKPPLYVAAYVQYRFHGEEVTDCSQKMAGRQICSTSMSDNPSMLLKAFRGSGLDKVQCVPARSN